MDLTGKSLFIANRGEIAVRINRAAKALGMQVMQAHSEADADMLAVRMADRAVELGPPAAHKSYLDVDARGCRRQGARARMRCIRAMDFWRKTPTLRQRSKRRA